MCAPLRAAAATYSAACAVFSSNAPGPDTVEGTTSPSFTTIAGGHDAGRCAGAARPIGGTPGSRWLSSASIASIDLPFVSKPATR